MNKRQLVSEKGKNIIIVLLLLSAVFLGWQSRLFGNSSVGLNILDDKAPGASDDGAQSTGTKGVGEARPLGIAVTNDEGAHYIVKYDMDKIGEVYNNAVIIFREALGSARAPEEADEQEWRATLLAPGVYFEYMTPVRLSVLDGWFGEEMAEDWGSISVRRLFAAAAGGETRLYFQDAETGIFYAAGTAAAPESITKLSGLYAPNDASFAFEAIGAPSLEAPYTLVIKDEAEHPKLEAKNPLTGETLAGVLRKLDVSEHKKPIVDENGNQIYPEDDFRIVLTPDGTLSFKRTGGQEKSADSLDESGAVGLACQAVADTIGKYCGDARVYFEAVSSMGNSYRVTFTYVAAGGRIHLGQAGYAAAVTITGGDIGAMELHFRHYKVSSERSSLMPELQAAAAAGGAFMLCYTDGSAGILEPAWIELSPNS